MPPLYTTFLLFLSAWPRFKRHSP